MKIAINTKTFLAFGIKIIFAISIIYWMYSSGKIDVSVLQKAMQNEIYLWLAVFFCGVSVLTGAMRWAVICQAFSNGVSVYQFFKMQCIGCFFGGVLPGVVSGDIAKIHYLRKYTAIPVRKREVLFAILYDRVVGAVGLLFLSFLSCLILLSMRFENHSSIFLLVAFNAVVFLALYMLQSFLVSKNISKKFVRILGEKKLEDSFVGRLLEKWRGSFGPISALALLTALPTMLSLFFCTMALNPSASSLFVFLAYAPIAFILTGLSFTPSGLGVGHYIFYQTYEYAGLAYGAEVFTVFFLVEVVFQLVGMVLFLLEKKAPQTDARAFSFAEE